MPHISRFKLRNSDRDGFTYKEITLLKQGALKVGGVEFDTPPPSRKSLGGEGDVAAGITRSNSDFSSISTTDTPAGFGHPTVYITAAGGITPSYAHPFMYIAGSNSNITVSANPQIVAGQQNDILTLACVGSSITLANGNGVALMGSARFVMDSGSIITLIYSTGGSVWQETSRTKQGGI